MLSCNKGEYNFIIRLIIFTRRDFSLSNNSESSVDRLRKLRKSYGYTQERMAEELGISISLYKGIESGKCIISRRTAEAVEHRFGVSADYIYCGTLRDESELWEQIYECNDADKMKILFRLMNYFAAQYRLSQDDDKIKDIMAKMFEED